MRDNQSLIFLRVSQLVNQQIVDLFKYAIIINVGFVSLLNYAGYMFWATSIFLFGYNEDSKIHTYKRCAHLEKGDSHTLAFDYLGL